MSAPAPAVLWAAAGYWRVSSRLSRRHRQGVDRPNKVAADSAALMMAECSPSPTWWVKATETLNEPCRGQPHLVLALGEGAGVIQAGGIRYAATRA
jgi:hypothetical protein